MFACFVWEPLSHHLNLASGQRATGAISLQQSLSDFLAYTRPPTIKTNSLAFVLMRDLDWFARECPCILQSLDLDIVVRFHLFYSLAGVVVILF